MFFNRKQDEIQELREDHKELIEKLAELEAEVKGKEKLMSVLSQRNKLQEQITTLKIERSKIVEDHARRERELTHKIGLEKTRQEVELEQGKRQAKLEVGESNLKTEREQFQKQMDFTTDRFKEEIGYVKDIMTQIMERLPTITVERNIEEKRKS